MDTPVLPRQVRDGDRILRFRAAVLAAATTQRPGAPRWTELTVYRLPGRNDDDLTGGYVVAKIGRSVLVHRKSCHMANPRVMKPVGLTPDTVTMPTPHLGCTPDMEDPSNLLERTKYQVLQARAARELVEILLLGEVAAVKVMGMTAEVVQQLCVADTDFNDWWATEVLPKL